MRFVSSSTSHVTHCWLFLMCAGAPPPAPTTARSRSRRWLATTFCSVSSQSPFPQRLPPLAHARGADSPRLSAQWAVSRLSPSAYHRSLTLAAL